MLLFKVDTRSVTTGTRASFSSTETRPPVRSAPRSRHPLCLHRSAAAARTCRGAAGHGSDAPAHGQQAGLPVHLVPGSHPVRQLRRAAAAAPDAPLQEEEERLQLCVKRGGRVGWCPSSFLSLKGGEGERCLGGGSLVDVIIARAVAEGAAVFAAVGRGLPACALRQVDVDRRREKRGVGSQSESQVRFSCALWSRGGRSG